MREIKFRAWSQYGEGMLYQQIENHDGSEMKDTAGLFELLRETGTGDTFMQYTGLKDKNGREIYEGDIVYGGVPHVAEIPKKSMTVVVEWEHKKHWSGMSDGHNVHHIGFHIEEYYIKLKDCEVIGNIHENPELL